MKDEALKLALDALKELVAQTEARLFAVKHDHVALQNARKTITAIKQALAAQPAVQEPVSPEEHLMGEAHKYWKHANARHHGAVQWIENNETGELLIYTRGEYRDTLMANITNTTPPAAQPAPAREDWGPGPHEYHSLPAPVQPVDSEAKGAIMGAAYDFRDAHISGSMNLKRSAHAALEAAVDAALNTPPVAQHDRVRELECVIADLTAECKELRAAQPAIPDAITDNSESPEYRTGWNDCRAEMLKGMK